MEADLSTKLHRQHQEKIAYNKYEEKKTREMPKRRFTWGQCAKYEIDPKEVINNTASLPKCCSDPTAKETPIQKFYSGAHVLITGATGFMGKLIVEKLLVSCPKLEKLYLIIREKKGQTMDQRFDELFKEPVFERLRQVLPDFRKKLVAVNGDCSQIRMGLSDETYEELTQTINIVIHGAATVRFDEKIRTATNINVRGVREILEFSRKCPELKSVVHISTAYANCLPSELQIEEKFYPSACNYETLMKLVEEESEEKLSEMTPKLISPWPNTYAFTKQVAEEVVKEEGVGLPLAVYRPAVVIASAKEPIKNWSDNIYGPTGVIAGAGTGVLRVVQVDPNCHANNVPVDMAVNGVIAAAWKAQHDVLVKRAPTIYNYVSSNRNPVTFEEFSYWNGLYGRRWPTVKAVWYPMFFIVKSRMLYLFLSFFLHTLPAYVSDAFLFLTGQERMTVKGYRKIAKFVDVIAYFGLTNWRFDDDNVVNLWNSLSPMDKEIYPFNIADLDWDVYAHTHLLGLRVHIAKDNIDTIHEGRIKYKRLFVQHVILCAFVVSSLIWVLTKMIWWSFT